MSSFSLPRGTARWSAFALGFLVSLPLAAQMPPPGESLALEGFQRPPAAIERAVMAPWHENVSISTLSPDRSRFIHTHNVRMPALEQFARPYHILAGQRFDAIAYRSRGLTTGNTHGFDIRAIEPNARPVVVDVPEDVTITSITWSPDSELVVFLVHYREASHLYVADANTGQTRRVSDRPLQLTTQTGYSWWGDDEVLTTARVFPDQAPPARQEVPDSPMVRTTGPTTNNLRTWDGLLRTPEDQEFLRHYITSQLVAINIRTGQVREIGDPMAYTDLNASPFGEHFIATWVQGAFSYMVPFGNFGRKTAIMNAEAEELFVLSDQDLRDGSPGGGGGSSEPARRNLTWHPQGDGMVFLQLEPQRQGTPANQRRDQVMHWKAPFGSDDQSVLYSSANQFGSVAWDENLSRLFITREPSNRRTIHVVNLSEESPEEVEIMNASRGFFDNPGTLVSRPHRQGLSVVRVSDDDAVYVSATQYFRDPEENAPRPFLDRLPIGEGDRSRLFESAEDFFETVTMLDDNAREVVVTRQSRRDVPNSFLRSLPDGREEALTQNRDFAPRITQADERRVWVTRMDGRSFMVTVLIPRTAQPPSQLPAFFWFYPREYANQTAYNNTLRTYNKNSFRSVPVSSASILLEAGYVVVFNDCPLFGPPESVNDTLIPQLRDNLSATIDALDRERLLDRSRLGIGGHSYGGFSTANALLHTPFFRAGIAGAGNYNRLLTPFGFQSERRQLWQGREIYTGVSALMYANQLNGALLLYHGADDENMGTAPMNSERLYQALEALGKTASLYMYPYEGHGQRAMETRLDMWARWVAWLDQYVKNGGTPASDTNGDDSGDGGDSNNEFP